MKVLLACLTLSLLPALCLGQDAGKPADSAKEARDRRARESAFLRGEITFDDLKFDIEKDQPFEREMLTERVESLHERTVQIRGYILPATLFRETNIDEFVLVRDNQECCFGPGAALFDCVIVNLVNGVTTNFTTRPVTVKGKFRIKEFLYPDGSGHFAVFHLEGVSVK